ncbi:hypothetical protein DCAR_0521657 [Daucus carota subsp. sativus]|uniref:UDP-glycosyltransferase n=3 Tax=Daucus carota subsp. sativus TaxID=79200 RepID=A0AAF0X6I2_DAUCS|nr:PREDICTED: UDP-glucose iridoid glucosyltransferase-like isoform X1 [Daucus carota subsp. sativus]XP_017250134.1 PREDICTED: UDP-glucose iridoid glucosyltransferase-like isoform X1 [Daucus carota subsp. sativus]XP_017250135.1 PREDICTED: UDP-glucose iridoid glucosyltransferase-like isoform X2 [Daucus carota subsp. sativus]WOH02268.1 hypothetical protein DCAR_0521657 [Daucus carota subsp. sativus]
METQGKKVQKRLVLVPFPFQGHMTPMLQLGAALEQKGLSVTIAHTCHNAPDPSQYPRFEFRPLADNLTSLDTPKNIGVLNFIKKINTNCEAQLQEFLVQKIEQEQEGAYGQVVGIIYDTLMFCAEAVADKLKIPSMVIRTSFSTYVLATIAMPRLQAEGYFPLQDSMLEELVPELYPLRFKDLPFSGGNIEETLALYAITSNLRSSSAIIWNTVDFLEHLSLPRLQQHYKVPFFTVGPLHKTSSMSSSTSLLEEDKTCMEWLDKQATNSVIYVSLGSLVLIDAEELTETAWGLANSGHPFLWVIRPGSVIGSEWLELLPEGFIENVGERCHIVKWAPQKLVLAHKAVGGFWSHCGWNSTLESLCEGKPMMCRPFYVDQPVVSRFISYVWKIGLELETKFDRRNVESTIRRLFGGKEGEEMRERAIEIKEKIESCMSAGGSSFNSLNNLVDFFL